jgi:hypothetical protein
VKELDAKLHEILPGSRAETYLYRLSLRGGAERTMVSIMDSLLPYHDVTMLYVEAVYRIALIEAYSTEVLDGSGCSWYTRYGGDFDTVVWEGLGLTGYANLRKKVRFALYDWRSEPSRKQVVRDLSTHVRERLRAAFGPYRSVLLPEHMHTEL